MSWPAGSGCATPRLVALDLDPEIARYEADEEVQDLLNASPGLNLGIDFLPGSFGFDGDLPTRDDVAARVLWLDAFCANVDRSWRNPNLLLWHGDLWVIDHGASLYFHHAWGGGVTDPDRFARQPWDASDHVLRPARRRAGARSTPRSAPGSTRACSRRSWPRCPTRGSSRCPGAGVARRTLRAAYVAFLTARLGTRQWLPAGVAHEQPAAAYQYVVLRCVPRVDREEFLNVGVVLYCQAADFLEVAWQRRHRPAAGPRPAPRRRPGVRALAFVEGVCAGDERGGAAAGSRSAPASASSRHRAAPCCSPGRSTAA